MRRPITGLRTIVAGASRGIGAAVGTALDGAGADLILSARSREGLETIAGSLSPRVTIVGADQTVDADRGRLFAAATERWDALDALVCCAGVGAVGPFEGASPDRLRDVFELNTLSTIDLIREALPLLRRGRRPIVVVISSVLGHRAVPGKAEYSASKFALHGFCDAVRAEWAGEIDMTLISPGTVASPFWDHLLTDPDGSEDTHPPAETHAKSLGVRRGAITPQSVAKVTVAAMRTGRHEVILPVSAKMLVWLDRLWPTMADRLVARYG